MELFQFQELKERFKSMSTDDKINTYISAEGLSQGQYRELLKLFPINELGKLEEALK